MKLAILILLYILKITKSSYYEGMDLCFETNSETCSECISSGPDCAWVLDEKNFPTLPYCITINEQTIDIENLKTISNPNSEKKITLTGADFNMRIEQLADFELNINLINPQNQDLEIYLLIDFSNSMESTVNYLKENIENILIPNAKHGLGIFVDKPVFPFIAQEDKDNCCQPTFSFKHLVSITDNASALKDALKENKISINNDSPEGSLDALVQVAACKENIGWGSKFVKRIVVLLTDGGIKFAGDGKIAAITEYNEGGCYLEDSGDYNKSKEIDYPSIHILEQTLLLNKINLVVLASEKSFNDYKVLVDEMKLVKSTLKQFNNGNIAEKVALSVKEIRNLPTNIEFDVDKGLNEYIELLNFELSCGDVALAKLDNSIYKKCDSNSNEGIQAEFVTIDLNMRFVSKKCIPLDSYLNTINHKIVVVGVDHFYLTFKTLCYCDCELPLLEKPKELSGNSYFIKFFRNDENFTLLDDSMNDIGKMSLNVHKDMKLDSAKCSNNGYFACGQCYCLDGWKGKDCSCNEQISYSLENCLSENENGRFSVCSNRGQCICGKCDCISHENLPYILTGDKCQCSESFCPDYLNLRCGGVERGECKCDHCKCKPKYMGQNCSQKNCSNQDWVNDCRDPQTKKICNGNGDCECGECYCYEYFYGDHCEFQIKELFYCNAYKLCATCLWRNKIKKEYKISEQPICSEICNNFQPEFLVKFYTDISVEDNEEKCQVSDSDSDCILEFLVDQINKIIYIKDLNPLENCQKAGISLMILALIIVGVILAIVFIALLIYLITVKLYEKKAFKEFMNETSRAMWCQAENPIYRSQMDPTNDSLLHSETDNHRNMF